ncbi:MAG: Cupin 2, conserved barrel domain protein [Candidatus Moranbacteria bacterium GW2011_GWE1_49_15]|nr:MAG: Cupin 2, conserved barrel domain protein [Candidatus Moranbacteria bacterium GW2011_GWE1_49_15]HBP01454.1 cupin domain-containing protein [Candidatus Moranbacteria bacterium]
MEEDNLNLRDMVAYQEGSVVSREVLKTDHGSVTLFAFEAGQGLSEHTAPFDVLVNVIDGEGEITISGKTHVLNEGQMIIMPANEPHSLNAQKRFKMFLVMLKK